MALNANSFEIRNTRTNALVPVREIPTFFPSQVELDGTSQPMAGLSELETSAGDRVVAMDDGFRIDGDPDFYVRSEH